MTRPLVAAATNPLFFADSHVRFNHIDRPAALVTGASSGIGRAIAIAAGRRPGPTCWFTPGKTVPGPTPPPQSITALGRQAEVVLADLADRTTHEPLARQAWAWQGAIDILVNNAGADVLTGEAAGWSFEAKLQRLWQVDVGGTIGAGTAVWARMNASGGAGRS